MADVPDPVFSGEVLGKGCAVWPEDDLVYAPCDGKVPVTMGHAVGLQSDSGIEVLAHVGVDTVNMNGDGFEGFVKADDVVKAGQPMLKIDRAKIAAAGYMDCGGARLTGEGKLECVATLREGEVVFDPEARSMPDWQNAPAPYWTAPGTTRSGTLWK